MAATGYTPISLYYSTTAAAVPVNTNLVNGELALNITDGKLYYKDNTGTVKVLAGAGGAGVAGGSNTQVQYNSSGSLAGSALLTFDGTTFTAPNSVIASSSSSDALRITQTGSGNALLVEDSTNPDATPFVIDTVGRVAIGSTTALTYSSSLSITPNLQVNAAGAATSGISRFSATTGANSYWFLKSRGATIGSFDIVASGDTLGTIGWLGADGTDGIQAASIIAAVDGTPGTNDMPGRLTFSTTADGASTPTERMRINSAGNVGIGSTALTNSTLRLGNNITGGVSGYGIYNAGTIQPDVTGVGSYFGSSATTAANGAVPYTISDLMHYRAVQSTFNADSTVTNQYGFAAQSSLIGATNNYGFHSNIALGTGRWNFYGAGSAANYFAGNTAIGTTTTTAAQLTIAGSSSVAALKVPNIKEVITVSATAATGTIAYNITTQSVLYYTTNASANWTVNFRGSAGTTLDTLMSTGESMSVTFLVTQGSTAYYNSAVQVDGTTSGVTTKWQGGTAPTSGNASSIDSYTYVIIKTGSATFTVLASQTKFA